MNYFHNYKDVVRMASIDFMGKSKDAAQRLAKCLPIIEFISRSSKIQVSQGCMYVLWKIALTSPEVSQTYTEYTTNILSHDRITFASAYSY